MIEEIGNRERETVALNRINQRLKEEVRRLELSQLPDTDTPPKERVSCIDATTQSEEEEKEQGIENSTDEMIQQQIQKINKLGEEVRARGTEITQKSQEIENLKGLVGDYRNRLENILGENSAREREIDHLNDSLDY